LIRSIIQPVVGQIPLEVRLAKTNEEIREAFKLRYRVFVEEEKADLANVSMVEKDAYDDYCDHLIVVRTDTQEVVGTYRLLNGMKALKGNGFYSETEFDLSQFRPRMPETVELGRSCVLKEFRDGRAISLLWAGIGQYILLHEIKYLIGCASLSKDAGVNVNEIYTYLKNNHLSNEVYVEPKPAHKIRGLSETELTADPRLIFRSLPPLVKGYLRLGAFIAGEPAYDPVFNTFDLFMVLDRQNVVKRYQQNYLKAN
jgi:putative hemolysin